MPEIEMFDLVRIVVVPETTAAGWAEREGTYYGFTTPSVTGIDAVGLTGDLAVHVDFGDSGGEWFDPRLVERVGYDPQDTMRIGDAEFVRDQDGNWVPKPN
jgi:hypothetical protein